jgi:SAM-dependent methyltransferase
VDLVERGQWRPAGRFVRLDYRALPLAENSADLVSCFIGLHHCPPETLDELVASIARILRRGGVFVLRDHDVGSAAMHDFVSLAHTVFNAGLGVPWEVDRDELRHFAPLSRWIELCARHGLRESGPRLLQPNDPTLNTLLAFTKE